MAKEEVSRDDDLRAEARTDRLMAGTCRESWSEMAVAMVKRSAAVMERDDIILGDRSLAETASVTVVQAATCLTMMDSLVLRCLEGQPSHMSLWGPAAGEMSVLLTAAYQYCYSLLSCVRGHPRYQKGDDADALLRRNALIRHSSWAGHPHDTAASSFPLPETSIKSGGRTLAERVTILPPSPGASCPRYLVETSRYVIYGGEILAGSVVLHPMNMLYASADAALEVLER